MRAVFTIVFLLFIIGVACAQNTFKIFTSRSGVEIDEEFATQVNIYEKQGENRWLCTVYDLQTQYRLSEYTCTSVQPDIRDGVVRNYWKGDTIWTEYQMANGIRNGYYKSYYLNGQVEAEGLYEDGEKEGQWKYYYPSGQLLGRVTYRNHEKLQWQYFTLDGKVIKRPFEDATPEFPGGMQGYYSYMSTIPYPQGMLEKNISGVVEVVFIVDSTGNAKNPTIGFSTDTAFSMAVLKAFENMPTWRPGYKHSRPVNTMVNIPVIFRAQEAAEYKTLSKDLASSGTEAFSEGNYEKAYKYFKEAVYLDPFDDTTLLSLAIAAINFGKIEEGCKCTNHLVITRQVKHAERYLKYCDWPRYGGMPVPSGMYINLP